MHKINPCFEQSFLLLFEIEKRKYFTNDTHYSFYARFSTEFDVLRTCFRYNIPIYFVHYNDTNVSQNGLFPIVNQNISITKSPKTNYFIFRSATILVIVIIVFCVMSMVFVTSKTTQGLLLSVYRLSISTIANSRYEHLYLVYLLLFSLYLYFKDTIKP